jgi:hypothetical protein
MTAGPDSAAQSADAISPARAVIEAIQDGFRRGDYAAIAARYDDDVDWLFYGPPAVVPAIGQRRGKVAVFQALEALNAHYRFERHVTERLIAEDDRCASIADVTLVQRASGRTIRCRVAGFFRVRDGKVVEYRGFMDSFDAAEQVLGRELKV